MKSTPVKYVPILWKRGLDFRPRLLTKKLSNATLLKTKASRIAPGIPPFVTLR